MKDTLTTKLTKYTLQKYVTKVLALTLKTNNKIKWKLI